jgi:hypothetical protein
LITIWLVFSGTADLLVRDTDEAVITGLFLYASEGLALMRSVPARLALLPESSRSFLCASLVSTRATLLSGTERSLSV